MPEGLDMIARALRAGHAFTTGMKLAADEFNDPLGPEFSETIDEINFGVSVPAALKNMAKRVDCPEIKYFIVAIILQRESGGDLAELLSSLAGLIRDKFKFQGKVRTLTAEGRISAAILVGLPFLVLLALNFTSHDYIKVLFMEPVGRLCLVVAGIMMSCGIYAIKKIITIDV